MKISDEKLVLIVMSVTYFFGSSLVFPLLIAMTFLKLTSNGWKLVNSPLTIYLCFILLISLMSMLLFGLKSQQLSLYLVLRDTYYFLQPIIVITFLSSYVHFNRGNFNTSLVISVMLFFTISAYLASGYGTGVVESELDTKRGTYLSLIGLSLVFFASWYNREFYFSKFISFVIGAVFLFAILFSQSRFQILLLISMLLIPIIIKFNAFNPVIIVFISMLFFFLFGDIVSDVAGTLYYSGHIGSFYDKILNSISELTVRSFSSSSTSEMTTNWRAYEAYLARQDFMSGSMYEMLIGKGLGYTIYTPNYVFSQANQLDVLPIFHNGYFTIILKSGIVGMSIFVTFCVHVIRLSKALYLRGDNYYSSLSLICFFYFSFSTLLVHGLYKTNIDVFFMFIYLSSYYRYRNYIDN